LRCAWCHNPEGIPFGMDVWWRMERCIGCGACVEACPSGAISADAEGRLRIEHAACAECGDGSVPPPCADVCPSKALEPLMRRWTVDGLVARIERDRAFIEDGGGVTFSGGEPLAQSAFVAAVARRCRESGLHVALDTSGCAPRGAFDELLPFCDLVLFDLKSMDSASLSHWTGGWLDVISDRARIVAERAARGELELWFRTPLVPGATDSEEGVAAIAGFIGSLPDGAVARWELCAFHGLCVEKYRRLGAEWTFEGADPPPADRWKSLRDTALKGCGLPYDRVFLKGLARASR